MNITENEIKKLEAAKNGQEWNEISEEIKAERGGAYPPDWYAKVIFGNINPKIDKTISFQR